jgi:hypothetical protein
MPMRLEFTFVAAICAIAAAAASSQAAPSATAPVVHGHHLIHRWVYVQNNFQAAGTVERVTGILERAAQAGFNGVIFADVKFGRLDDGSLIEAYNRNLAAVLGRARELGLETLPATADFGYSSTILWHDPNLAEALPVRAAVFRAEAGRLVPRSEPSTVIVNGDFENLPATGHAFPGWAWQDEPGTATFVDRTTVRSGQASLRMENLGTTNAPYGNGRAHQRIAVRPFHNYHVSVWVKTQGFRGGDVRVLVLGQGPDRTLQWNSVPVQPTQDWTRFDVTFNSLSHDEILFYFGVWGGGEGTIWWDDGAIEPAGFVNLVRRPGAPVRLTSADGSVDYEEGRDVESLYDPLMGTRPWNGAYDAWHTPPEVRVPNESEIPDGAEILVDYYHTTTIYGDQVPASLTEPAVFDIVRGQLASLQREFAASNAFSGWHFSHDEIRLHGWDEAPTYGSGSPGANLAHNITQVHADARAIDPGALVSVWSDMFDPYHNADTRTAPYYLVNGDWSGSWEGLAPEIVVVNWNHGPAKRESAAFFAGRGNRQVLAGYYDSAPSAFSDRGWLADLTGLSGIAGVMYTPWTTGFDHLEAWAEHVWGDAEWVAVDETPTPAPPTATDATPAATPSPARTTTTPTVRLYLPSLMN